MRQPANGSVVFCHDIDTATFLVKRDMPINEGEQGVIFTLTDATTSSKLIPDLANQNVPGAYLLATEFLDASPLGVGVTTVAAGTLSLLVCHYYFYLESMTGNFGR